MFGVINLKTGRVITANEFASVDGTYLFADDFMPSVKSDGWGFRFRIDSSLLVVVGAPDEDESKAGAYYFVLKGERLRLIHTTRPIKNSKGSNP